MWPLSSKARNGAGMPHRQSRGEGNIMTMKKISAVSAAQTVCAVLLSVSHLSDAAKDSFKVRDGPVDFLIDRYDDGRSNPYVITFTDFELTSVFEFDADGLVTVVGADEETYNPFYETNHKLRQVQYDYSKSHRSGRNSGGRADGMGGEATSDYKSNDKVNQVKRGYSNLRQPSDSDERSAAARARGSTELQPLHRAYSRHHPALRGVKAGAGGSDPAWDEYTLFEHQTAPFRRDIDADSDGSRAPRLDQARLSGGEGDTVVDTTMFLGHDATTLTSDADADAGRAKISRRTADRDTSILSGIDLEEHRLDVTRHGPDKCEGCQQTWDTLCDNGVDTVCSIVQDGQVVSAAIEESINMLCVGFGTVCSELSALDVCDAKCEEGQDHGETEETEKDGEEELEQGQDGEECLPPLTIAFEWTPLSELQPDEHGVQSFVDIYVIEPHGQMASWNNTETNSGFLRSTGSKASYTLLSGLDGKHATGTYSAFAELWFGSSPVSWTATATTGRGEVLYMENGVFTGDGGPSSSSTRYSVIEEGFMHGTSKVLYANLAEYVDNGCKGHGDKDTEANTMVV